MGSEFLVADAIQIQVLHERDASTVPWHACGVQFVVSDSTLQVGSEVDAPAKVLLPALKGDGVPLYVTGLDAPLASPRLSAPQLTSNSQRVAEELVAVLTVCMGTAESA